MTAKTVVAVDIGGSGLRLQLSYAGRPGSVLTAPGARVGPGGVDVTALVGDARGLLSAAGARARGDGGGVEIDAVCWSQRGLLMLSTPRQVLDAVVQGLGARRTAVVSDAVAALVGALGAARPGAVVAAGTGAIAFASDFGTGEGAVWRRIDGWGHVIGDRGSAAWVGLQALQAATCQLDGVRGGSGQLLGAVQDRLGPPEQWPQQVMTRPDAPELLAGLAPLVSAAAEANDGVAQGICERAGRSLAEALVAAAVGIDEPLLSATGGVLTSGPIRRAFEEALAERSLALTAPRGGPLDGALHLAGLLGERGTIPEHPAYVLVSAESCA